MSTERRGAEGEGGRPIKTLWSKFGARCDVDILLLGEEEMERGILGVGADKHQTDFGVHQTTQKHPKGF